MYVQCWVILFLQVNKAGDMVTTGDCPHMSQCPKGEKTSDVLPLSKSKISGDKSFADDLNKEQGIGNHW